MDSPTKIASGRNSPDLDLVSSVDARKAAPRPAGVNLGAIQQVAAQGKEFTIAAFEAVRSRATERHESQVKVALSELKSNSNAMSKIEEMTVSELRESLTLVANIGLEGLTLTECGFAITPSRGAGLENAVRAVDSYFTGWMSGKQSVSSVGQSSKENALNTMLMRVNEDITLVKIVKSKKFQEKLSPSSLGMLKITLQSITDFETLLNQNEFTPELVKAFEAYMAESIDGKDFDLIGKFFSLMYENMLSETFETQFLSFEDGVESYHECLNTLIAKGCQVDKLLLVRVKLALMRGVDPSMWNEAALLALARTLELLGGLREVPELMMLVKKIPLHHIQDMDQIVSIVKFAYAAHDINFMNICLMESGVIDKSPSQEFKDFMSVLETMVEDDLIKDIMYPLLRFMLSENEPIDQHPKLIKHVIYYLNNPESFKLLTENQKILVVKAFNSSMKNHAATKTGENCNMFRCYITEAEKIESGDIGRLFSPSQAGSELLRRSIMEQAAQRETRSTDSVVEHSALQHQKLPLQAEPQGRNPMSPQPLVGSPFASSPKQQPRRDAAPTQRAPHSATTQQPRREEDYGRHVELSATNPFLTSRPSVHPQTVDNQFVVSSKRQSQDVRGSAQQPMVSLPPSQSAFAPGVRSSVATAHVRPEANAQLPISQGRLIFTDED